MIYTTFKELKYIGKTVPFISLLNFPVWLLRKLDESWRMTINYYKLIQVVSPIAVILLDMITLLDQISKTSNTLILATNYFLFNQKRETENHFHSYETDNIHLLFCSGLC